MTIETETLKMLTLIKRPSEYEMKIIRDYFSGSPTRALILKDLAEGGPRDLYSLREELGHSTVQKQLEKSVDKGYIELAGERTTSKKTKSKVYALTFPLGFLAALAYVGIDLDMEALRDKNASIIQGLSAFNQDFVNAVKSAWKINRDGFVDFAQFALYTGIVEDLARKLEVMDGLMGFFDKKYQKRIAKVFTQYPSFSKERIRDWRKKQDL